MTIFPLAMTGLALFCVGACVGALAQLKFAQRVNKLNREILDGNQRLLTMLEELVLLRSHGTYTEA